MTSIPLELDIAIDPDESLDPEASDSDDLSSNFTDYTEVSLLEATDAADFGPSLTQILVDLKSDLVDQVMGVVHNIILSKDGYIYHQSGNDGSQGTQGSTSGTPNQSSSNQARKGPGKRPLSQKDDRSANGGNDGDPSKRKKLDSDAQLHSNILRKFACPFYQHNPQKNSSRRSCRGPGWPSVHRVKYINNFYIVNSSDKSSDVL